MTVRQLLAEPCKHYVCAEWRSAIDAYGEMDVEQAWSACDNATWMCIAAAHSPHADDTSFRAFINATIAALTKEELAQCRFLNLFNDLPTLADMAYAMCFELVGRKLNTNQNLANALRQHMPDFIL